jgi:two-component system response regulator MprA
MDAQLAAATPTLLVVDDDANIARALSNLLEDEGYRVVAAENGKRGLELVDAGLRPSAIILDLMMPEMDGWDFRAAQMKSPAIRETPVIVLTATGFSRRTIREQFGGVEYLLKPPSTDHLLEMLRRVCAQD